MGHFSDMMDLVLSSDVPFKQGDRFVVWILTVLSYALAGMEPETMVGSVLVTLGVLLLSVAICTRKFRTLIIVFAVLVTGFGISAFEMLKLPLVAQDASLYGKLAIHSIQDYPNLPAVDGPLVTEEGFFKDQQGRVVFLRGVNLGGDTKVPTVPDGATWRREHFYDTKGVSFVGRPFALEKADEHLGRLRSWGFTFLRFLITWEAIEHDGPGIYDEEYLAYVLQVIRKCRVHGISVFIDPHQDVWSRWTGGDGAPAWTLEKVGFEIKNLHKSAAAFSHQEHGLKIPQMIWPTNYNRLAAATMFTLFFAGNTYARNTKIDGVPVQEYLQGHYIRAVQKLADIVRDEPNVLGYDTLNEPSTGYAGVQDLNSALFAAPLGWFMSGFQGMVLGAGRSLQIPLFEKPLIFTRLDKLNPNGVSAWKSEKHDIWRNEGVWKFDENGKPALLRPNYFSKNSNGDRVHFMNDFMVPFFRRFESAIHKVHPGVTIFGKLWLFYLKNYLFKVKKAEPYIDPNNPKHAPAPSILTGEHFAWAPHYYDAFTLLLKKARPWLALDIDLELPVFTRQLAQNAITQNLGHVRDMGKTLGNTGKPVLVGEIGIAFDHDRDSEGIAAAYKTGDFSSQILALDRSMQALESNLLSFTLWCYAVSNNNRHGDNWNDEDLSLFSHDQRKVDIEIDSHSGGRALQAAVRPYPLAVAGNPLEIEFKAFSPKRQFKFVFENSRVDPRISPTIIFVPTYQFPKGINCTVSDGSFVYDMKNQIMTYIHNMSSLLHTVRISMP